MHHHTDTAPPPHAVTLTMIVIGIAVLASLASLA